MFPIYDVPLPSNCEIEVTFEGRISGGTMGICLTSGNGNAYGVIIDGSNMSSYRYTNSSWKGTLFSNKSYGPETYPLTVKLVKEGSVCYMEVRGVKSNNFNMQFDSSTTIYTGIIGNAYLSSYVTGFSIKPL